MEIHVQWARTAMESAAKEATSAVEWEMKYRAMAAGITDRAMIENADLLVRTAFDIASSRGVPVLDVFWCLLDAVSVVSRKAT